MIKIYGDSHSRIFKKIKLGRFKLDVENISGASLNGLPKTDSKLKIRRKIFTYLKNNNPDYLILKFGQVDIDLRYYYKIVVKNEKIIKRDYVNNLILKYVNFINELSQIYPKHKIIIFGINPPSLLDKDSFYKYIKEIILKNNNTPELHQKLYESIEPLKQRTNFSKLFNLTCRYFCEMNHIKYTEVFNQLLNSKNIICPRFTNNDDHHLNGIESDNSNNNTVNDIFRATLILTIDS